MSSSFLSSIALFFLFLVLYPGFCQVSYSAPQQRTYIVHMAKSHMPSTFDHHSHWYDSTLRSVSDSAEMLYTYNNVIHGFSTRLTPQEADSLMSQPGVISILPEKRYELHTTRTPLFLGIEENGVDRFPNAASDIVIGVLDSGVWPERKSFSDEGVGPIPSTWKGECEVGTNFTASLCNRKLIGARFFTKGYEATMGPMDEAEETRSPRDDEGHGTHTSSTAAGSVVKGANLLGYAPGTARGMAPNARVAVYKICWVFGCFDSDILAAMDKAIDDNVDIMSMSLGSRMKEEYYNDSVAIGAFAAMERGILVYCSAGNAGPSNASLANVAPWITTVGAGTIDRDFPALAILGNGKNYSGVSLYKGDELPLGKLLPFVYAGNASSSNATDGNFCFPETLIPEKVKGKIVLCDSGLFDRAAKGEVVKEAGGVGMILANTAADGEGLFADAHVLPATEVGAKAGDIIRHYVLTDPNPTASILIHGTAVNVKPAPVVAYFSSRGPNLITPNILKPDLIAPGVNILAAWTGAEGPTDFSLDPRRVPFNIASGTSMSCPHVSGLAALLKSVHPEWSPAAIRSALMTTSYKTDKDGKPILDSATRKPSTPFDHGAGHVSPIDATDPGLIYDLTTEDYLGFLCAMNYTSSQIRTISKDNFTCDPNKTYSVSDLNYPSFAVKVDGAGAYKYPRTVTNVGGAGTYSVKVISETRGVKISVEPAVLNFKEANEKKSYTVTFTVDSSVASGSSSFASIEWSDGKHVVKSPVAIMT